MLRSFSVPAARFSRLDRFFPRGLCFAPEGGDGNGGQTPPPNQQPPADPSAALTAALQRLSERGGDSAALVLLERQATRIRELEGLQPPQGAIVLTGDDAARWQALSPYKPDELKQQLERLTKLEQENAESARRETLRTAATVAKLNGAPLNADALVALSGLPPVEVTGEGDNRKAEVVKDGVRTPLADYLTANYAPFLPSLQAQGQQSQGNTQQQAPAYPAQHGNTQQGKPNPAALYIAQTYRPRPAPTTKE